MTTTPAMPEPFAWAWRNKVTGAKGVYFEDPKPFGITSHPDYEWTNLYTEAQPIATLQSQPAAEVSDELILKTLRPDVWTHVEGRHREQMLADARAILALRQQVVPMTDAWAAGVQAAADLLKRMADETALERGETDPDTGAIQFKSAATREWHASLCELAEEIERLKPAHHGITARGAQEGV